MFSKTIDQLKQFEINQISMQHPGIKANCYRWTKRGTKWIGVGSKRICNKKSFNPLTENTYD